MPATPTEAPTLRLGARVLLLDRHNHVLLIHAQDPHEPNHHWWGATRGRACRVNAQIGDRVCRVRSS
jgi:hypothetical protein